jgi:1,2-dihydroxy-3-keto-5-methylthiopentene dioxygenase
VDLKTKRNHKKPNEEDEEEEEQTTMGEVVKDGREEVIQAWYMDDSEEDQRLPHHKDPKEFLSLDKLAGLFVCFNSVFFSLFLYLFQM